MRSIICVLMTGLLFVSTSALTADELPPNPYGVAGYGVLDDLNMPADCVHYDWNGLHTENPIQMCRPNHYYDVVGIPYRWWGYDQDNNVINDPAQFDTWILANPGKIWIIANEPDLGSQDGLTREQYAHMYKLYYDFISSRDATARFCIGAVTGGSTTGELANTKAWYQYVLDYYEATYSEPMHIDIWNIHSYVGPLQIEDPDQPIRDFVEPFVNWCHTVEGGIYANAEVWITELPVGEWKGALSEEWIAWFAQRYMPRLERAGIDRWFWFVSRANDIWATVALVKSGVVSTIGQTYSDLANGYPNDVIPVTPYVPEPTPAYFEDDFSGTELVDPWMVKAGLWLLENNVMRQSRLDYPWNGETCPLQYIYDDFDMSLKMRINNATNSDNWAGVLFHTAGRFNWSANSGYLVYMRQNGKVGLYNKTNGTMTEIANAIASPSEWQDFRIQLDNWRIKVWVNGAEIISAYDSQKRFGPGYTMLTVNKTDSSFDDVQIWNRANTIPTITSNAADTYLLVADDETPYNVTVTANDPDGGDSIVDVRTVLHDGTFESDHSRGSLAWGKTDADITSQGGIWTIVGDAVGGGRWGYRTDGWGADTYITPIAATTTTDATNRSVTFTFTVKPAWTATGMQSFQGYTRDVRNEANDWTVSLADFRILPSAPGDNDGDGDVDQTDFGLFQACFSGPGIAQFDEACTFMMLDEDDDVDGDDFTIFAGCMSGPGMLADTRCAG